MSLPREPRMQEKDAFSYFLYYIYFDEEPAVGGTHFDGVKPSQVFFDIFGALLLS